MENLSIDVNFSNLKVNPFVFTTSGGYDPCAHLIFTNIVKFHLEHDYKYLDLSIEFSKLRLNFLKLVAYRTLRVEPMSIDEFNESNGFSKEVSLALKSLHAWVLKDDQRLFDVLISKIEGLKGSK